MAYKFEEEEAKRVNQTLKIGISGPSGSGKTYSSLLVARGLVDSWDEVGVVDTENNSASLYSDLPKRYEPDGTSFRTLVGGLKPPYNPQHFIEAMNYWVQKKKKAIVVDTASKEWDGVGGILDQERKYGNKLAAWKILTPKHTAFLEAIQNCPVHLILTLRAKADYLYEEGQGKKMTVQKVGLKPIQREGFEYELTTFFAAQLNHHVTAEKDRTTLFDGKPPFVLSVEHGKELRTWANSGAEPEEPIFYSAKPEEKKILVKLMYDNKLEDPMQMKELADRIKESRIPMDNFEEIASHQIKGFITEKEAS